MEQFLADYGLKWLGKEGSFHSTQLKKELDFQGPAYKNNLPPEIDTEVLSRRIDELNWIAEKSRVVKQGDGVNKFEPQKEFNIWFFKNGLQMKGFKFYPYHSKEAQSVLSDILDGYFPYDLKEKFPNGVPLKPIDKTDDMYDAEKIREEKKGPMGVEDFDKPEAPMGKQTFLKQFPESVVKDGVVVPVREEMEKRFKETQKLDTEKLNSNEPIEVQTHVILAENQGTEYAKEDLVTLRIRTENGKRNIILKMLASDTIGQVYDYLEDYKEDKKGQFEVRASFPRVVLERNDPRSLKELGLYPTGVLVMHKL